VQAALPLRRLVVVEAALSDHEGEASLFMPASGYQGPTTLEAKGEGFAAFKVRLRTLENYCRDHAVRPVHFIKLDVEGFELEVFKGGEAILREDRPALLFECADFLRGGGQVGRVFAYLDALGYQGFFFPEGRMEPISGFRLDKHQKEPGPDWCMNFGFLPRQE
jgi:FkbM family methyltransferase